LRDSTVKVQVQKVENKHGVMRDISHDGSIHNKSELTLFKIDSSNNVITDRKKVSPDRKKSQFAVLPIN
jgi:hypothetical protein